MLLLLLLTFHNKEIPKAFRVLLASLCLSITFFLKKISQGIIRQLLLPSLDDSYGKIRTAIGMAVASIAQYDWPEDWPELLPFLLKLISDQGNKDGGIT